MAVAGCHFRPGYILCIPGLDVASHACVDLEAEITTGSIQGILIEHLIIRKESMESLDILILGVEASIALAGFAGIIATFQFGGEKKVRRGDAVGLTMILQFSLLGALVSSMGILLYSFEITEAAVWSTCTALVVIVQSWATYNTHKHLRGIDRTKSLERLTLLLQSPTVFFILINLLNTSDTVFHREAGPIIASIVYALCIAGFMFSRLLLQPIWRSVRIQEAAKLADAA